MNSNYGLFTKSILRWRVFILMGASIFIFASCNKTIDKKYLVRIDMSKEHDGGRFKPELGDKINLAGSFNEWNMDTLSLSDQRGDWIFSAYVDDFLKEQKGNSSKDTLEFSFVVRLGSGRETARPGWETVKNRKIALADLEKKKPIFVFNEVYDERETFEITFRVGMNNQKVLGFFCPEAGDEVVVSGSFCNWSPEGIPMKDEDGEGVYSIKSEVKENPQKSFDYKFRIVTKRKAVLQNQGWETRENRQWSLANSTTELPYAEFNDLRRVARFTIDTKQWEQKGRFKPKRGDILQIKLSLDGKENLSDALFQVKDHIFETAMAIPLTAREIQWSVARNIKEDLTQFKSVEVDIKGAVVSF